MTDDEIKETVLWLRRESDLITNSLHCGDSSTVINFAHRRAAKYDRAADLIEKLKAECESIVSAHL